MEINGVFTSHGKTVGTRFQVIVQMMCIDAGIYLTSLCGENNLVDNNTVNSNTYNGIYVETHNNIISNNYASGNRQRYFLIRPKMLRKHDFKQCCEF